METSILGLDPYQRSDPLSRRRGVVKSSQLKMYTNRRVTVSGRIITAKRTKTRRGEDMKFITVEDNEGLVEIVLFPKVYRFYGDRTVGSHSVSVRGVVKNEGGSLVLNAERLF